MWLPFPSSGRRPASLLSTLAAATVLLGLVSATQAPPITDAQTRSDILPRTVFLGPKCKRENIEFECLKDHISFPTYDCIRKDLRACGLVGANSIFYSFGADYKDVKVFKDSKKGVVYNDAMGDEWWLLLGATPRFQLAYQPRQDVLTARFSQAMASLTRGETFLALPADFMGHWTWRGAYTIPNPDGKMNMWRSFEFPQLQRNPLVTKITLIDVTTKDSNGKHTFPQRVGWLPDNEFKYPRINFNYGEAKDLPVPGVPQQAPPKPATPKPADPKPVNPKPADAQPAAPQPQPTCTQ